MRDLLRLNEREEVMMVVVTVAGSRSSAMLIAVVVRERLEAFAGEVSAEAMN